MTLEPEKRNLSVEAFKATPMEDQYNELVERKGLGHPDSIADGLSEAVSVALCKEYLARDGIIHHHNTDETQIVGGQSQPRFGGGKVLEPAYILLVGRAVNVLDNERLPIRTIAVRAARDYLKKHFKLLDLEEDVVLDCKISPGSQDLRGVYDSTHQLANDTSFGVGFAPFSQTENIVLKVSDYLNKTITKEQPGLGTDTKVMACRLGNKIKLTLAAAMVDRYIESRSDYIDFKCSIKDKVMNFASQLTDHEVLVDINTADDPDEGVYYLTVTGLSMENGDDGSVGRGNRCNGLITPGRPMSMEATSGKNPVTHVGKIYNLLSNRMAHDIVKIGEGQIVEAHVRLLSQIGVRIDYPLVASAQLIMAPGESLDRVKGDVEGVMDDWMTNVNTITDMVIDRKLNTF